MNSSQIKNPDSEDDRKVDHLRFHRQHEHLSKTFGNDFFGVTAESFARFFGTPVFLGAQTVIVAIWIAANALGFTHFDLYPFILLNLAFSLQAAYAAPLILLAQTRQAARDNAHADADAKHREAIAVASAEYAAQMLVLLRQNTELTEITKTMAARIEKLTTELHHHLLREGDKEK
ncbi:hypothetical protein ASC94_00035 [Massilia sp. Root418]|jgi:uncharacterized membrane protein|uniref:DUF1003 domain-containing protein n=1 Tax=unclassified Massilia TaxID=2609279 RepID=UPI0006F7A85F|nr:MULTISPECIES: DUF1003 domain-containing protein [unclassified Massilia]KQV81061.1 hypothetical protein ASD15_14380 [Massilia sp. Root351]KQX01085.1 hypothetical protein ASC94_00035 [Massilia sp. Root418]